MKLKISAIAIMLAIGTPAALASHPAPRDADAKIAHLFKRWNSALKSGDEQRLVALYAPDAVLQPTLSSRVRSSPALIEDYFSHFIAMKPIGRIDSRHIHHLGPESAVDSGLYTFSFMARDGERQEVQARYTFVYRHIDGQWKIVNHHSSLMPES